jgi:low temperature requirement protein LtrA
MHHARPFTSRTVAGYGVAAAVWLVSALAAGSIRYSLWTVALVIDLGTPWLALRHTLRAPPHSAHLPERFGLFTLILLGEAVVAVMHGMKSQEEWHPAAAATAFLGMGLLFLIWWWYFDVARAVSDRPVRSHRDTVRLLAWSYVHFPLYVAVVVLGVGIERAVMAASRRHLPGTDMLLLGGAVAVVIASLGTIRTLCSPESRTEQAGAPGPGDVCVAES